MMNKELGLVGIGGFIGASARHLVSSNISKPYGTLVVNSIGSLLIGVLFGIVAISNIISKELMLLLGVGILGAFTTKSAVSSDLVGLFNDKRYLKLGSYFFANSIGGPILAFIGWTSAQKYLNKEDK